MEKPINIRNKKAGFEYELLEKYMAGIQLLGSEIKSIRANKASISEAYCAIKDNEVYIYNMHIAEYANATYNNHPPKRQRKLLLQRSEIFKLEKKIKEKGFTLVPIKLFINKRGLAKLEIALARGKKLHDKRDSLKQKEAKRRIDRAMKHF